MDGKNNNCVSINAVLLTFIKLVTTALALVSTRLLSENLSVKSYGTYSQVLLIVSTVVSVTVLGMIDAVNFFYAGQKDKNKAQTYISTIYAIETAISIAVGSTVMLMTGLISRYMENPDLKKYILFAALLPFFQNLIAMTQVLVVASGKAKVLAVRNLTVSLFRLGIFAFVSFVNQDIGVILTATVILDIMQLLLFFALLRRMDIKINLKYIDLRLVKEILKYALPMAAYVFLNTVNRDCDKYIISFFTDTETLAVYANASKALPFDILSASFITVLVPKITRLISSGEKKSAVSIYKRFLEISYVSTGILTCAAIVVSPELMRLLYSEKYLGGLRIFIVYILVDLLKFTNITLILSAAGKTKVLMAVAGCAFMLNIALNVLFFNLFGIIGPAVATLVVSMATGVTILKLSSKALSSKVLEFFDIKYLILFFIQSALFVTLMYTAREYAASSGLNYFIVIAIFAGSYACTMLIFNGKRLLRNIKGM